MPTKLMLGFATIHGKSGLVTVLYVISAHSVGFYNSECYCMAAPKGDSPGGSHMVLGEPPKMAIHMYICVKSKSRRAVASKVPLSKLGARVAARLLLLEDDPAFILLWCIYRAAAAAAQALQSCPTLCNPVDYSLPGSSVHGIL